MSVAQTEPPAHFFVNSIVFLLPPLNVLTKLGESPLNFDNPRKKRPEHCPGRLYYISLSVTNLVHFCVYANTIKCYLNKFLRHWILPCSQHSTFS